jgi:hypothetical protein
MEHYKVQGLKLPHYILGYIAVTLHEKHTPKLTYTNQPKGYT